MLIASQIYAALGYFLSEFNLNKISRICELYVSSFEYSAVLKHFVVKL